MGWGHGGHQGGKQREMGGQGGQAGSSAHTHMVMIMMAMLAVMAILVVMAMIAMMGMLDPCQKLGGPQIGEAGQGVTLLQQDIHNHDGSKSTFSTVDGCYYWQTAMMAIIDSCPKFRAKTH